MNIICESYFAEVGTVGSAAERLKEELDKQHSDALEHISKRCEDFINRTEDKKETLTDLSSSVSTYLGQMATVTFLFLHTPKLSAYEFSI